MTEDGKRRPSDRNAREGRTCTRCGLEHRAPDGRLTCAAHRRDGQPCGQNRIIGSTTCRLHAGKAPQVQAAGRRRQALEAIKQELTSLGGSIDVDPAEAMLAMVREAAWNVAWLRSQVEELRPRLSDGDDAPVLIDEDGVATVHPAWVGAAVAGRVDPANWKAEPHVLVRMYNDERDRLVRYAKLCRDAGIEERRVQVEEEQARWVVAMLDRAFEQLELTAHQRERLPAIMGRVVSEVEAGDG